MDRRTIEHYRKEFPVAENAIYLDHAGVAPISVRVQRAVEDVLRESSSRGAFWYPSWAEKIAETRQRCARLIRAEGGEIAFVKNTSHGLSLVAAGIDWERGDNVIFCDGDFPSNIYPWLNLRRRGVDARPVTPRNGTVLTEDIEANMDDRTRLVAVSSVHFASGSRIDTRRLGRLCRERNILFCVDAIQGLGVVPVDAKEEAIDFLAADAHKWLLGPEGIGIFYCRQELAGRLEPALIGWKSMQNDLDFDHPDMRLKNDALRFEEGSQNLLGIIGLGAAVELLLEVGIENIQERVQALGDRIIWHAAKRGFELMTPRTRRERGGAVSFRGGFDPTGLRDRLRERGILVNARGGGLRVSPHFYNTEREIDGLFEAIDRLLG